MKSPHPTPPKWADRFLEWYCKPELLEPIQGDMYERFDNYAKTKGLRRARQWYIVQVFLFINLYTLNMKHLLPQASPNPALWLSYVKTGYRNALKNRWTSLINVTGLTLATGCMIVVFVFLFTFFSNDDFHENLDEIYVVERVLEQENGTVLDGLSPMALGPALKENFAQIHNQSRFTSRGATVKIGDEIFAEWVSFADSTFPQIFSFPVKWGNFSSFSQPTTVVLSEEASRKYFGEANPIGQELTVIFDEEEKEMALQFEVKAVIKKLPANASFGFDLLFPYASQSLLVQPKREDWKHTVHATFLQIKDPHHVPVLESQLDELIAQENKGNTGWRTLSYHFHPLSQISIHSSSVNNSFFVNAHLMGIILIVAIALIILLQVCFNFINSTLALLSNRIQEISYRKVLGVRRKQIAFQFLVENLSICLLGMGIGTLLAKSYFIPWFSTMSTTDLTGFSFTHPYLLLFGFTLLLILVLGGTGYPALFISKLSPKAIAQQRTKLRGRSALKKSLLGVQFAFTFLALFATFTLFIHSKHMKSESWGYNPEDKLVIRIPNGRYYPALAQAFSSLPEVKSVSGSVQQIGAYAENLTVHYGGGERKLQQLRVGPAYLQSMGISLSSGKFPFSSSQTERSPRIWVNEKFAGGQNVVGTQVRIEGVPHLISGVLGDFRQEPFDTEIKPMIFRVGKEMDFRYMTLLLHPDVSTELITKVKKAWLGVLPLKSFTYFFQDEVFQNYFLAFEQINQLLSATAGISIIISLTSLLGLLMLSLSQKMKEISIRRVLGAGNWEIGKLLNREFLWPQLVAFLVSAPLGFFLVKGILTTASPEFASPSMSPYFYSILGMLGISLFALYVNLLKLRKSDPVKFLRSE